MLKKLSIYGIIILLIVVCVRHFTAKTTQEIEAIREADVSTQEKRTALIHSMANYLTDKEQQSAIENSIPKEEIPMSPRPPFSTDFLNSIESGEIKKRLMDFDSAQIDALREEIQDQILRLDSSQFAERIRILRVRFWLESHFRSDKGTDFFLQQARSNYSSSDPNLSEFGKQSLRYYLELENNPEQRKLNYQQVTGEPIEEN